MSKKVITPINVLSAGDMSGDLESTPSTVSYMDNIAYQCTFTGVPVGFLFVEVSLDGTNWTKIDPVGTDVSVGSPVFFDVNQTSASKIRCTFEAGIGSVGVLNILTSAKEI